jgi:hypothetical protein
MFAGGTILVPVSAGRRSGADVPGDLRPDLVARGGTNDGASKRGRRRVTP